MKQQLVGILLLFFILFIGLSLSAKQEVKSQDDALSWLNKYGYNPCLNSAVQCSLSLSSILKDYQKRFHLKPSGKLDEKTKHHMNRPRCGNQDKSIAELNTAASLRQFKWSRTSLTYSLRGYPTQLNEAKTASIIREAFNAWLGYVPLKIEATCSTCKADFVIEFPRIEHSDSYPFDGIGGTLAHAFFPEDGRVHFDKDEAWTESFDGIQTNLYLVAVHEIGHALGLDHTYNEKSIMYPSYQPMSKSNILPQPDRDAIQKIYGTKQTSYSTTTRSTTTTTTTTRTTTTLRSALTTTRHSVTAPAGQPHPRCRRFLDAAINHPDGTLHTLSAGVLWRYLPNEHTWESSTSTFKQKYPNLPNKLAAGAYDSKSKEIVFFTDKYAYHYDIDSRNLANYHNEERLPRNLQNSIVGAIYYHNEIHVITPKTIRSFQVDGHRQSDERDLSEEFPRFSGTVKTAFSYGDLHHFFTSDRLVYIWSERLNSWQTFAKPMETNWIACSGKETYITKEIQTEQPIRKPQHRESHRHRHHHHHHY